MKKLIIGFVLLAAGFCLAEEVTVTTNAVKVIPSFGSATSGSMVNTGDVTIYARANVATFSATNGIPVPPGWSYTFTSKPIYHVWVATTNGTCTTAMAFE